MTASETTERVAVLEAALKRAQRAVKDDEQAYRNRAEKRLRSSLAAACIASFLAS